MWQMNCLNLTNMKLETSSSHLPVTMKKCHILHDRGAIIFCHPVATQGPRVIKGYKGHVLWPL